MYRWTENLSKSIIYTKITRIIHFYNQKKKKKRIHRKGKETLMKHGELQDQLLLELITAKFRLLLQRSMYQWTENLSKSIIYTSRRLSRELFIFITKKKKKRIHRKGKETSMKRGELQDQLLLKLIIHPSFDYFSSV